MKRKGLLIAAMLAVTGCAQQPVPLMSYSDPAVIALNDAAQRVARAAEQASLAQSVTKDSRVTREFKIDTSALAPELREPILLEGGFNGELEVFLKSLTDAMGWSAPEVMGPRPTTPLLVTMTEQRRPPVYWIADAGYQVGAQAEVILNASLRQVIVLYSDPSMAGGI